MINVAFPFFAMGLLSDGWLFVLPDDVLLSAGHHQLRRIRVNAAQSDKLLDHVHRQYSDIDSVPDLCQCVAATLIDLERDDTLSIYRASISRDLKQYFDGDLTPLVMAQFMCAGYLKIEQTGERAFCVVYDKRFAQGILKFRDYMHRFVERLCAQSKALKGCSFTITFAERQAEGRV